MTVGGAVTADELVLLATTREAATPVELAREAIHLPEFEAEAVAKPDTIVNPVDLRTILVPAGWLLLGPDQSATLEIAAISRTGDLPKAQLKARFDSAPARVAVLPLQVRAGEKSRHGFKLPERRPGGDRDVLTDYQSTDFNYTVCALPRMRSSRRSISSRTRRSCRGSSSCRSLTAA